MSCSVAKLALPITRFSIMRPASCTSTASASSASLALVAVGGGQLAGVVAAVEVVGEGDALLADRGQLGAALGNDLVFVEGGVRWFRCSW